MYVYIIMFDCNFVGFYLYVEFSVLRKLGDNVVILF